MSNLGRRRGGCFACGTGPFGLAWSQALLDKKAGLSCHPQAPGEARRQQPAPSQGSPSRFSCTLDVGALGEPAETQAPPGR